jgi:hypothetical protein
MRTTTAFLLLLLLVVLAGCSSPSGTVTVADRDAAMTALSSSSTAVNAEVSSWSTTTSGNVMTATSSYGTVVVTYLPDSTTFATAPTGSLTMAMTLTGYPAGNGYTVSGTFTTVLGLSSGVLATMSFIGNDVQVVGPKTYVVSMNASLVVSTSTYSGSCTVNGQSFAF